jgi:hypothetical protein
MHICQEEIMAIVAAVPAVRFLLAYLVRTRAVQVWWSDSAGLRRTLHCASCKEELE